LAGFSFIYALRRIIPYPDTAACSTDRRNAFARLRWDAGPLGRPIFLPARLSPYRADRAAGPFSAIRPEPKQISRFLYPGANARELKQSTAMRLEHGSFRPPAPFPRPNWPGPIALLRTLWNNPIEAWSETYFEQPIVRTHLPFADIVVVNEPGAIRRVLNENATNYCKDRFQKRMLAVLSNGLLTAEDAQWQFQRRLIAPLFTAKTVKSMAAATSTAIDELVVRWRARDGQVLDVAEETTDLALIVLERTIFSAGIAAMGNDMRWAMRTYFDSLGRIDPFDLLDFPDFIPRLSRLHARPAIRLFHQAVDEMIATRERRRHEGRADDRHDMLMLLIDARDADDGRRLTAQEIRANIITFMAAGHESTANAVTWALYLLSRSPQWRERVHIEAVRELNGPSETLFDRLVQTRAVIEESLRLYPPLAAISRMARASDELAGMRIEAGTMVVISPYVLHRHRIWGKRADQFDPARFLPGSREYIDRYAYLPFGAGARGCIGSVFALQEATMAVAAITQNFELAVANNHAVWPVHRITLRPRDGLPMLVRRRAKG
jgi:cytochrome P450